MSGNDSNIEDLINSYKTRIQKYLSLKRGHSGCYKTDRIRRIYEERICQERIKYLEELKELGFTTVDEQEIP